MHIQILYGDTDENNQLLLPEGSLSLDLERKALRLHDGTALGGYEILGHKAIERYLGPGPQGLIGGNEIEGFYGTVTPDEFIDGVSLAAEVGISAGIVHNNDEPWLKFALDHKVLFIAKKTLRYNLSWDHLNAADLVYGNKTVNIGGYDYRVRLLRGANSDPTDHPGGINSDHPATHGSEWNRLLYRVCSENPPSQQGENWAMYSESELGLTENALGRATWCREVARSIFRMGRGGLNISGGATPSPDYLSTNYGWRPVLELMS